MIYALALIAAFVGLALQVWALADENLRIARGCLCRKGAWNPECPLHGRSSS